MGILKPVIFIPYKNYEDKALELILKHELIHYKHKDLSYKLIVLLARGMHWFNPLVHFFAQGADQDLEIICDETVLRNEDVQAKKYYMENILQMIHEANFSKEILTT